MTLLGLGKAGLRVGDCLGWGDCQGGGRSGPRTRPIGGAAPHPHPQAPPGHPCPQHPRVAGSFLTPAWLRVRQGSEVTGRRTAPSLFRPHASGAGVWSMGYSGGCEARVGGGWPGRCPAPLPLTCAPLLCRGLIHLLTHMAEALHQARLLVFLVIPPAVAPG